jgi:hypothetical protein
MAETSGRKILVLLHHHRPSAPAQSAQMPGIDLGMPRLPEASQANNDAAR